MNYLMTVAVLLAAALMLASAACRRHHVRIAVIPRTTGVMLWEYERAGAVAAARRHGYEIYWNAPTREDDVEGQIALLDRIAAERFDGVILAPDQALALMTPVRKLMARGIPTVIVSSALPLVANENLSYILNDDDETGRLAAERLGEALHGRGPVALLSLDPNLPGLMAQVRAFEASLSQRYPDIRIVDRRLGAYNGAEVQQITADVLERFPKLDGVVSFTAVATRGAYLTLQRLDPKGRVKLIGCEQEGDILEAVSRGKIDGLIAEDSYHMGQQAVESIARWMDGHRRPVRVLLKPLLITQANINSERVRQSLELGASTPP